MVVRVLDAPAAPRTEKVGNKIVIDFWNGFTGPDGKTMEKMVRQFQAENRDIQVRMQIIPWGTYYDKLTLSLAYGGAPEVFIMHAARLPEFAAFDTLQPLDPLFATAEPPLTPQKFATVPWQASFYKGRQLALPLDVHPIGLYYNTQLFKDAGIVDANGQAKPPRNAARIPFCRAQNHQRHQPRWAARSMGLCHYQPTLQLADGHRTVWRRHFIAGC